MKWFKFIFRYVKQKKTLHNPAVRTVHSVSAECDFELPEIIQHKGGRKGTKMLKSIPEIIRHLTSMML